MQGMETTRTPEPSCSAASRATDSSLPEAIMISSSSPTSLRAIYPPFKTPFLLSETGIWERFGTF